MLIGLPPPKILCEYITYLQAARIDATENIESLHEEEEFIRNQSIEFVIKTQDLNDHLQIIHSSMAIIYALCHDHKHTSDDQLTIQYLGLR